jgi:hypothetical protein
MNNKQIGVAALLIIVVAGIAWGTSRARPVLAPVVPAGVAGDSLHILSSTATTSGDYVHEEHTTYYDISAVFPAKTPLVLSNVEADTKARTTIEQSLAKTIADYKTNLGEFDATMQDFIKSRGVPLALDITYTQYTSPAYVSYEFDIYDDSGGAHPNTYFSTFVFDKQGSVVALADLFVPQSKYLTRIADESKKQITAELNKRLGADGQSGVTADIFAEGYAPKAENFSSFVIDGDTLVVFFPPYQVAAYAAGNFEVRIPLATLADILKK